MAEAIHPAASHHLPGFITAPGQTDILMVVMGVVLAIIVLGFGVLFLRLHTLPERIAHKTHRLQFEIVAVMGLIALFTHQHIFWVIGLLLALIDLPDFGTPLRRIAASAEKIAGVKPEAAVAEAPSARPAAISPADQPIDLPAETGGPVRPGDGAAASPSKADGVRASQKELSHA